MNATELSADELLRTMPPETKTEVLTGLLRELIRIHGGHGLIPFTTDEGEFLGYYVPPEAAKAQTEAFLAEMPPAVREQMTKPLPPDFDPDDCLTDEELEAIRRGENPRSRL